MMPRGHAAGREKKRPKKKVDKPMAVPTDMFTSPEVEVIKKKRKPKDEEF